MADCFQVTTTLPSEAAAQQVAAKLVDERLAACAQVMGPVSSTYCNLKTTNARLPALTARIRELHPYEVPEIIAIRIEDGDGEYLPVSLAGQQLQEGTIAAVGGAAPGTLAHMRAYRLGLFRSQLFIKIFP